VPSAFIISGVDFIEPCRFIAKYGIDILHRLLEQSRLGSQTLLIARGILRHIVVEKPFEVSIVMGQPIGKSKEAENHLALFKSRLRCGAALCFSPIHLHLQLYKQVIERTSVDAIPKFLFIEDHRAAIEAFEYLVPKLCIRSCIDDDASNRRIEDLLLLLLGE